MKTFKLLIHNKGFSEESLVISPKDYPTLVIGDIVEISSTEEDCSPLLVQVTTLSTDILQKGCISVDQAIATYFQLKMYTEVSVRVIENLKAVSLDSVELTFKDQYLARSDMWRLKNHMINTCLYPDKKLDYFGIRCQVLEMYLQGEKVSSGIVTEDTKIVYRSASSMVYLFIQMSCEMWDFDINGDLYFEKAIDGFLPALFSKWKKLHCNHDVTIVLFSRTFYEANHIEEFPSSMRECLQQDYKGRFFEDFYRVAVQNERYDDWSPTVILLKKLFNEYLDTVLKHHEKAGLCVPKAINSTSSQGNFLEVLNMSLNVFEKHYMDRSFDRTGQLSVVISPGVGFFEVDRELTIITKQRIIDNGIGSDLVCLGEQPLHAVPLFKFHNKQMPQNTPSVADDYNMPHWINLSFYSTKSQNIYTSFVPRIKLPTLCPEEYKEKESGFSKSKRSRHASQPDPSFPVLFDYDEYDRQVFKVPAHSTNMRNTLSLQRPRKRKETLPNPPGHANLHSNQDSDEFCRLTSSEPAPIYQYSQSHASSSAIAIPHSSYRSSGYQRSSYQSSMGRLEMEDRTPSRQYSNSKENAESDENLPFRTIIGSDPSSESTNNKQGLNRRLKALVNPFNPSQITIKLTSNRRRWTHVFPLGPTGIFMQQHHYQAIPQISAATLASVHNYDYQRSSLLSYDLDGTNEYPQHSSASNLSSIAGEVRSSNSSGRISTSLQPVDNLSSQWGPTGEQEWTPAITTGVDWKSMVIPACLPITTDYFPDRLSLKYDYVISDYDLLPEDISTENAVPRYFQNDEDIIRRPLTTPEVYNELVCQRLQQGFQIILLSKQHASYPSTQVSSSPQFSYTMLNKGPQGNEPVEECLLSIGRIFHKLNLDGPKITVTHYRPRHPHREIKVHYCYRFHAPDSNTYGVSWVDFTSERLENYNWNYLDHYVCNRGEGEFELKESLKYWRLRMLLLPAGQPETRKIIEGSERCDLYNKFSEEDKTQQKEGILKFLEVMNKVKRVSNRKSKIKFSPLPPRRSSMGQAASAMRDRVSSNRVSDRTRMRSNSARMGARPEPPVLPSGRISPATEADGRITIPKLDTISSNPINNEPLEDIFPVEMKKISENSTEQEIIQAMKHPQDGLNFVSKVGWSNFTFISSEAVNWLIENVEGILVEQNAIKMLQNFLDKDLICHVSRARSHSFTYGFYLYYIGSSDDQEMNKVWDKSELSEGEAIYLFEREWMQVELSPSSAVPDIENYNFPSDEDIWCTPYLSKSKLKLKSCNVQIDSGARSGRQEWGQLRYQNVYRPYETFEVVVEWMVATGNKAADLVQCWARKCTTFGFQLVPIPSDPFALPFSNDSDPLRGPIFIPLDLSCLIETSVQSLDEEGLLKLQEKILCKFGFIRYRNPISSAPPQYVHVSGSMFVMLPVRPKQPIVKHLAPLDLTQISSPHEEYITRHFSGVQTKRLSAMNEETDTKIGFLWSWNYMITKRWKNSGTVDENFMRKVMRDFRSFCLNHKSRLEDFWKFSDMSEFGDNSLIMDLES